MCKKNPIFITFSGKKRSNWKEIKKKIALCRLRWFKLNVSKCQKDVKFSKKMSSCQKDVKCQKFKHLDYGGGSQKIKLTQ